MIPRRTRAYFAFAKQDLLCQKRATAEEEPEEKAKVDQSQDYLSVFLNATLVRWHLCSMSVTRSGRWQKIVDSRVGKDCA
jgi:hypothetical protein